MSAFSGGSKSSDERPARLSQDRRRALKPAQIERLLLVERLVWEHVNDEGYGRYARAWNEFYGRWRKEESWNWPNAAPRGIAAMTIQIRPAEPERSEEYYEALARTMGDERAAWARLPCEEREKERRWYHDNFNSPDDLTVWPPELDGGKYNP